MLDALEVLIRLGRDDAFVFADDVFMTLLRLGAYRFAGWGPAHFEQGVA